jgi:hypothetical protein
MAGKTGARGKEAAAARAEPKARKAASPVQKSATGSGSEGKLKKGDTLSCELCGLTVVVDDCGDVMAAQEVFCCGQSMKPKARRTRKTTKAAAAG